ncbi:alpha/beta hydrolase [Streptomyces fractus]|uniref:alpha/beta hydrolase n=1 Tax=Streptomyces fractus TaxID=641806 RepID=UPI003CE9CC5C
MNPSGPDPAKEAEVRVFHGRRTEDEDAPSGLSGESRAALRQFSFERMLGYGVEYADAVELRARVLDGQDWKGAAIALAQVCQDRAATAAGAAGGPTRAVYLRRASALTRMSQVMMLSDTDERRELYAGAVRLYDRAAHITGDRERFTVATGEGVLTGRHLPAGPQAVGSAIVIGGVEGWAMDFDEMGAALAARGVETFLLDGPGQGESRMANSVYLTPNWLSGYRQVVDEVEARAPGRPIGMVGNSMGGSFAMALAAADTRITACCDNGGIAAPGLVPPEIGTFFTKMMAFCDRDTPEESAAVWSSVDPTMPGPNSGYPLLIVHGGKDPLVSDARAQEVLDLVPAGDREMVAFSDGDHCIYNHREDRDLLVADWMRARLAAAAVSV